VIPRASRPIFMFCVPGLVFDGIEGDWSRFRQYRGRRDPISFLTLPDSFLSAPGVAGHFFLFCAPRLIFGSTGCDVSRFHLLCSYTRFRRYRGFRVPFSCFVLPDLFSTVSRASGPIFMFCTPRFFFGGTEGVGTHFQVLCSSTHFRRY
jgi:hypothetical protein